MDPITLRITRQAGRGTQRGRREITGRLNNTRELYVDESGPETLIVSGDAETIMASGRDLYDAATELSEIHGVPVRVLTHDGREMFTADAAMLAA